jgi:predicted thioesterase
MAEPVPGPVTATLSFEVRDEHTAAAVGSGSLPVLGTPYLLAWCEAATCAAVEPALGPGETSVGTRVELEHVRASVVGAALEVTATPLHRDGRLHRFGVVARDGGRVVGTGEVTRVVVDAQRFLERL